MNSFVGDAAQILDPDSPTLPFLVLAGTGSPPKPKRQKKPFPTLHGKNADARVAFNYRRWSGYYSGEYWRGTDQMLKPSAIIWRYYARMSG
ncbi:hypothetical protein OIU92_01395 [Escherichia coli]|nr:hypothetical protein [Escherichia coli]